MNSNENIQERLKKLIEEKATEVHRRNSDKVEQLKAKLRRIAHIETILQEVSVEMNEQLLQHDKQIKVKSMLAKRNEDLERLDLNSSEMKIPERETVIGIAYLNSKHQARPAYCSIKLSFDLDEDKMREECNGRFVETHNTINMKEEFLTNLMFKMIEETDW